MKTVLTIAGSDSSGGAGIQADLKTMTAHHVYGMSAITALTAQNTTGVMAISNVEPAFLLQQLDAVFNDIVPDAVKVGTDAFTAIVLRLDGSKNFPSVAIFITINNKMNAANTINFTVKLTFFSSPITLNLLS